MNKKIKNRKNKSRINKLESMVNKSFSFQKIITYVFVLIIYNTINSFSFAQKKILFDNTKNEQAGNADWVIDANSRYPSPAQSGITGNPLPTTSGTTETYWSGALSSWGVDLAKRGYIVETLPSTGSITYGNAGNAQDLQNYHVFVVCEPNNLFTAAEKTAMLNFVNAGGGLFIIGDHPIADRDGDGVAAVDAWNDFFTSTATGFGLSFSTTEDITNAPTTNIPTTLTPADPLMKGVAGTVGGIEFHGGATISINKTSNPTLIPVVYRTGVSKTGTTGIVCVYGTYGNGRFVCMGDSSIPEDITPNSGTTYDGWIQPIGGSYDGHNGRLVANATIWLAGTSTPTITAIPSTLSGFTYVFGSGPSSYQSFTISGSSLAGSTVTVTPPTNYQICLTSAGTYVSTPITINYTAPILPATTVYIKLKAGLAVGSYNLETIGCSDNGSNPAPAVNVVCSGSVTAGGGSSTCLAEGFDGATATMPASWTFTNIASTYTTVGNFGTASPSLKLDATGDIIETPTLTNPIELKFWNKAQTSTGSSILVQGFDGTTWQTIENIVYTAAYNIANTKTYNSTTTPALAPGFTKFKFTYTKVTSNWAFDDVQVTCSNVACPEPVVEWQPSPVTNINTTSATFNAKVSYIGGGTNISMEGFEYGTNPNLVGATTLSQTGIFGVGNYSLTNSASLSPETQYFYRAFATNNCSTPATAFSEIADFSSFYTLSLEPTGHSASFIATAVSSSQINLTFSAASTISNADGYIIIKKTNSNPVGIPNDGVGYLVGDVVGDGEVAAIISNTATTNIAITGLNSSTNYYFKLIPFNFNGSIAETYNYNTQATIPSCNAITLLGTPTLNISETELTGYSYIVGSGPSGSQSFIISGNSLDGTSILVSAPTSFEVSLNDISFNSSVTISYTAPNLANTVIYIRLKAGLTVGNYIEESNTISGGGAASEVVLSSGEVLSAGASCATDLIISEYIEGSSNNKAIEIFNGTGSTVNLANYTLKKQANGAGVFANDLLLSGMLNNNSTYTIVYSSASAELLAKANLTSSSSCLTFNGNDAIALYKSGVQLDVVGIVDQITPDWGANVTLVRKASVTTPSTAYSIVDWDSYASDDFTYLNAHSMSCGPIVVPGDVNGDGNINVLDLVWLISHLNGSTPTGFVLANADVNGDLSVNIADLPALINLIFNS